MNSTTIGNIVEKMRNVVRLSNSTYVVDQHTGSSVSGALSDVEKQLATWWGAHQRGGRISNMIVPALTGSSVSSRVRRIHHNRTALDGGCSELLRSELAYIKKAFSMESIMQTSPWGYEILLQLKPSLIELHIELPGDYPSEQCFLEIGHVPIASSDGTSDPTSEPQLRIVQQIINGDIRIFQPITLITLVNIIGNKPFSRQVMVTGAPSNQTLTLPLER
jgi:CYTH domain-containing protein